MDKQQEFVLRTIEERGVKFIRLWFTDVAGSLKSVAVAPAEIEGAFAEGIGFDGSSIEGLARNSEADMLALPDPATFQILPWRGTVDPAARMFCDIATPDGQPAAADPRNVLRRTLAKAASMGFSFYVHPEIEFYLLKSSSVDASGEPVPVDNAGYFDNVPGGTAHDFRRRAVTMLEQLGISVEFSHHEGGPGQNEIDLRYADALTMADNIMTFRTVIRRWLSSRGSMRPSCLSLSLTTPARECTLTSRYLRATRTRSLIPRRSITYQTPPGSLWPEFFVTLRR